MSHQVVSSALKSGALTVVIASLLSCSGDAPPADTPPAARSEAQADARSDIDGRKNNLRYVSARKEALDAVRFDGSNATSRGNDLGSHAKGGAALPRERMGKGGSFLVADVLEALRKGERSGLVQFRRIQARSVFESWRLKKWRYRESENVVLRLVEQDDELSTYRILVNGIEQEAVIVVARLDNRWRVVDFTVIIEEVEEPEAACTV